MYSSKTEYAVRWLFFSPGQQQRPVLIDARIIHRHGYRNMRRRPEFNQLRERTRERRHVCGAISRDWLSGRY